jgi:hypothetical protein
MCHETGRRWGFFLVVGALAGCSSDHDQAGNEQAGGACACPDGEATRGVARMPLPCLCDGGASTCPAKPADFQLAEACALPRTVLRMEGCGKVSFLVLYGGVGSYEATFDAATEELIGALVSSDSPDGQCGQALVSTYLYGTSLLSTAEGDSIADSDICASVAKCRLCGPGYEGFTLPPPCE